MKKLLPSLLIFNAFFCLFIIKTNYVLAASDTVTATTQEKTECDPNEIIAKNSCPAGCNLCMDRVTTTSSCATTFNLYTKVEYSGNDEKIIIKNLNFVVDPKEAGANVPFVGKAGDESENKYLADYFEGTNEYYVNYGDQTTLTNYQGVLRKLTPSGYQDQLKKQLIARAPTTDEVGIPLKEDQIHNYQVQYIGRLCWNVPFWMDAGRFVFNEIVNLVTNTLTNTFINAFNTLKDKLINAPIAWLNNNFDTEIKSIPDANIQIDLKITGYGHYCIYEKPGVGWLLVKSLNLLHSVPGLGKLQEILTDASQKIPGLVHFSSTENLETIGEPLSVIAEHLPPDPADTENYQEEFLAWKKSGPESGQQEGYWYRLWQAVPMVTREVSIGEIRPYTSIGNADDLVDDVNTRLIKVPHLARLYETSKIINNILIPTKTEGTEALSTTPEISENEAPTDCIKENYSTGNGDTLCCQAISGKVTAEFENPLYEECHQGLDDIKAKCKALPAAAKAAIVSCNQEVIDLENKCSATQIEEFSQEVGVKVSHPFLDEIWQNTIYSATGFFNIFRPNGTSAFEDIDAATNISYSSSSEISPQQGLLYYPHLGGVQKAKEQIVNQTLWPYKK